MSLYDEFVAAYGRREEEALRKLQRFQAFAGNLLRGLTRFAGVPAARIEYVPLIGGGLARGTPINAMVWREDGWFHVRFKISFTTPTTNMNRAVEFLIRLDDDGEHYYAVKIHEDADPIRIRNDDIGQSEFATHLMRQLIRCTSLDPPPGNPEEHELPFEFGSCGDDDH